MPKFIVGFIKITLLFVAVFGDVKEDEVLTAQCNESFPITMDYHMSLIHHGSFPDETDKGPMCFVHCYMEKTGMISGEDSFERDVLIEKLKGFPDGTEIANLDEIVDNCISGNDHTDACEKAYGFAKCFFSKEIVRRGDTPKED